MLTVTIHVTTNQFLNMLIKFQSIKYFLFFRNRTSLPKLKYVNLLRFPDVDSPLVEKTLSIGAVEAGTHKMSQATGAIIGYSLIAFQKLKGSSSSSISKLSMLYLSTSFSYEDKDVLLLLCFFFSSINEATLDNNLGRLLGGVI